MLALFTILATISCSGSSKNSDTGAGWTPQTYCPGAEGCQDGSGDLRTGAAAVSITPTCFESWVDCGSDGLCPEDEGYVEADSSELNGKWDWNSEAFLDCGCDRLCPGDEGYVAPDEGEADGEFQAIWLAGFHNGRPAIGVHDDLWARAIVFEQGDTRVGYVVVDLVGWFYDDILLTREQLAAEGVDLDYLMVSATHNHESPDTMGLWGKMATSGGYDPAYGALVRQSSVDAVKQAIADLRTVGELRVGSADTSTYHPGGTSNIIRDSRDPKVIDEQLRAALFVDEAGETIASLSHFGNHPEAMADENVMLTSDFPAPLRQFLEAGVEYPELEYSRPGYGGTSIFISGAVGGLMTPLRVTVEDRAGNTWRDYTFERLDALGKVMAEMAMDAIDQGEVVSKAALQGSLTISANEMYIPIVNYGFQGMFLSGILDRSTHLWDSTERATDENMPHVLTEVAHLQVGPISFLTVPGEIFPELVIGGYDGSHIGDPNAELIDSDNPNPPDLSQAPQGPYIGDLTPGRHQWIVGLGNDELGYIVPEYDFLLDDRLPWFNEPEGDHYEETRSMGIGTHQLIRDELQRLIDFDASR